MRVLFGLTLFPAGALLFIVETLFAKMVMPKLGGTPAVWNVCMVFYQALLLAGYVYAHQMTKRFTLRKTALLQIGIVSVTLFALPIRIPQILHSPLIQNPTVRLLALLTLGMGLPFVVLTTYNSTLQTWYTRASSWAGSEPYFLYGASNLGSVVGLIAYPLVLERYAGLGIQSRLWQAGYIVLVGLTVGCGLTVWFAPGTGTVSNRYLDMRPVLGALAQDAGLASSVQEDVNINTDEQARGKFASTWFLMARSRSDLEPLRLQPNWHQALVDPRTRVWTDDYSSIAGIIHWN